MTTRAKWIALTGTSALLASVAFSQSPPFPSGLSFSASTRFVRSDYIVNEGMETNVFWVSEGANGEDQGLRVRVSKIPTSVQHRRSFTPAAGVTARVKMRIRQDHVHWAEAKYGFYSIRPNPFVGGSGSEPDYGAYFYQKLGGFDENGCTVADIYARINNTTGAEHEEDEQKLFTYIENVGPCDPVDVFDLIVEVNGTSNVTFYWKLSTDSTFEDSHTFYTKLPTGAMHFSAANRDVLGSNGYIQFRMFEWEVVED